MRNSLREERTEMSRSPFPVIDLTPFRTGDATARQGVARQIDEA